MYCDFLLANNLDFALPGEVKGLNATYLEKITLIKGLLYWISTNPQSYCLQPTTEYILFVHIL